MNQLLAMVIHSRWSVQFSIIPSFHKHSIRTGLKQHSLENIHNKTKIKKKRGSLCSLLCSGEAGGSSSAHKKSHAGFVNFFFPWEKCQAAQAY